MNSYEIQQAMKELLEHLVHLEEVVDEIKKHKEICKDVTQIAGEIDESLK